MGSSLAIRPSCILRIFLSFHGIGISQARRARYFSSMSPRTKRVHAIPNLRNTGSVGETSLLVSPPAPLTEDDAA